LKNEFLDKPAKLSSVYVGVKGVYGAEFLVDGIYEPSDTQSSMAHSNEETRPWWRVDLGDIHCVWAVNILNRYTSKAH